jgi:dTDP-4-dehydrorhamnose reductase
MKVVVLGARGLLGRHLVEELRLVADIAVAAYGHHECDILDTTMLRRQLVGAAIVINCAALTNVDGAEAHEDDAYRVNTIGAENVARAASAARAKLLHISTDFVFDGAQAEPYDEWARPNPLSIYARSKWAGEELVRARCAELFLARVQGLYGAGGSNFASLLRRHVLDGKSLTLDGERRVQPTWARTAARQLIALIGTDHYGVYHVSCKGETTWAGFAARLANRLGQPTRWRVVGSDALAAPARRPPNCLFRHRMLALRSIDCMPEWEAAQDEYLSEEAAK